MQTLYGIRITDRVRVDEGFGQYVAFFDDERVGTFPSGRAAVNGAIAFLRDRAARREREAELAVQRAAAEQQDEDETFLYDLTDRLGISVSDMETLIEIIGRRLKA